MMRPLHEGISVPDAERAALWYEKVFSFRRVSDELAAGLNARIIFLQLGDFELEIFEYLGADKRPLPPERQEPNEDIKTAGCKHLAWLVDDLDKEFERLVGLGADIAIAPFYMGGDKVCFIRDNSGILIELIQHIK